MKMTIHTRDTKMMLDSVIEISITFDRILIFFYLEKNSCILTTIIRSLGAGQS